MQFLFARALSRAAHRPLFFCALILLSLLSACGGGGGGSASNAAPAPAAAAAPSVSIVSLSPATPTVAQNVSMVASGSGNGLTYKWDFGDGQTGTGLTVSHSYASIGNYNIAVTATDGTGATAKAQSAVNVALAPVSAIINSLSPSATVVGQTVSVSGSGTGQGTLSYSWDFGDGSAAGTGANSNHSYSAAGSYTITLKLTDSSGASATASKSIAITSSAGAASVGATINSFSPAAPTAGSVVSFTGSGTGSGTLSYQWKFGDGGSASGPSATHTYSAQGVYTVTLVATDSTGASSTPTTATVTVIDPTAPTGITITPSQNQAITGSAFNVTGSATGSGSLSYSWDFGDGSTGTGSTATHTYSTSSSYSITLTVSDPYGQSSRASATLVSGAGIALIAGPITGSGSQDGLGGAAGFGAPAGVAVDIYGNTYIADTYNNNIRKISPNGTVTTIAGAPSTPGNTDGPIALATFKNPGGIAVDANETLYIADTGNNTIRKITRAGIVSTIAGSGAATPFTNGTGTSATFNNPQAIALDSNGNIYVADTGNSVVRMITPAGVVTTFAGVPGSTGSSDGAAASATFVSPSGLAVDLAGNVYVTDYGNNNLREISITNTVSTIAASANTTFGGGTSDGTGLAAQFSYPQGLTIDASGKILYVTDSQSGRIRKVDNSAGTANSAIVTTISGSSTGYLDGTGLYAQFNYPTGIAIAPNGTLFVADLGNSTIRKISNLVVTTYAGSVSLAGSADGTGTAALFNGASGAVSDSNGNLFVADTNNHTIRKITPAGVVTTFVGSAGVHGTTNGTGSSASFNNPYGLAIDSNGTLYVADYLNNCIRAITPAAVVTTFAGSCGSAHGTLDGAATSAKFWGPSWLATDGAGNLYVSDSRNHTIRKIVITSGAVSTIAGKVGVTGNNDGPAATATFTDPAGLVVDSNGNLFITDSVSNTIRMVTPSGMVSTIAGSSLSFGSSDGTGDVARFNSPLGITVDSHNNLYVADSSNNTIRKLSYNSSTLFWNVSTVIGSASKYGIQLGAAPGLLSQPWNVTFTPNGNLIVINAVGPILKVNGL